MNILQRLLILQREKKKCNLFDVYRYMPEKPAGHYRWISLGHWRRSSQLFTETVWEGQWIKWRIRRQNILLIKLAVMLLKMSDWIPLVAQKSVGNWQSEVDSAIMVCHLTLLSNSCKPGFHHEDNISTENFSTVSCFICISFLSFFFCLCQETRA